MKPYRPHNTPAASRRQQQIEECLQKNLLQVPYPMISVADLCRQLGISRRTFYTYYRDKEACLHSLIDGKIKGAFLHSTEDRNEKMDPLQRCTENFEYWKCQSGFLEAVSRQNMFPLLQERYRVCFRLEEKALHALLRTPELEPDADIINAFLGVRISLLHSWHSRNFDTPAREMAQKYIRLLFSPLLRQEAMNTPEVMHCLLR